MSNTPSPTLSAASSVTVSKSDMIKQIETNPVWFASAFNAVALYINSNPDTYNEDNAAIDIKMTYAMLAQKREVSDARKSATLAFMRTPKILDHLWSLLVERYNKQTV